ncbi:MAG: DUF4864 domain-containing protein [Pseudomonadota bacterium]|mgnify:FL=1
MKQIFAAILISAMTMVVSVGSAKANDDVRSVISSQIDAFLADDFVTAFDFASPMIQGMFGTPERFGAMVRNGYPMVWRPADVQFLSADERGGAVIQNVMIKDAGGKLFLLEYEMIETESGWLINGVRVQEAGDGLA